MFGLKQFIKTRTKLFAFFLPSQFSISFFLFKILNQNELHKGLKKYSKGDFFTIESLKINEIISIIRQDMNLSLLTLREMNCKNHTKFFILISTVIWRYKFKPWPYSNFENLAGFQKTRASFCSCEYK